MITLKEDLLFNQESLKSCLTEESTKMMEEEWEKLLMKLTH